MKKYMTPQEAFLQRERFEIFINQVDLLKIGQRYFYFVAHNNQDGRYNQYCYIRRVLRLVAKVNGSMYHPDHEGGWKFYSDLLVKASVQTYSDSLKKILTEPFAVLDALRGSISGNYGPDLVLLHMNGKTCSREVYDEAYQMDQQP